VLLTPVALPAAGNRLFARPKTTVTLGRQAFGIAFTGHDLAQNDQSGFTGQIAHHIVELAVHRCQRLLPVRHTARVLLNLSGALVHHRK